MSLLPPIFSTSKQWANFRLGVARYLCVCFLLFLSVIGCKNKPDVPPTPGVVSDSVLDELITQGRLHQFEGSYNDEELAVEDDGEITILDLSGTAVTHECIDSLLQLPNIKRIYGIATNAFITELIEREKLHLHAIARDPFGKVVSSDSGIWELDLTGRRANLPAADTELSVKLTCLQEMKKLPALYKIEVYGTVIDDETLKALADQGLLHYVWVDGKAMADPGPNVEYTDQTIDRISLQGTKVSNKGLEVLKSLSGLKAIHLGDSLVDSAERLAEFSSLQVISWGELSPAKVASLREFQLLHTVGWYRGKFDAVANNGRSLFTCFDQEGNYPETDEAVSRIVFRGYDTEVTVGAFKSLKNLRSIHFVAAKDSNAADVAELSQLEAISMGESVDISFDLLSNATNIKEIHIDGSPEDLGVADIIRDSYAAGILHRISFSSSRVVDEPKRIAQNSKGELASSDQEVTALSLKGVILTQDLIAAVAKVGSLQTLDLQLLSPDIPASVSDDLLKREWQARPSELKGIEDLQALTRLSLRGRRISEESRAGRRDDSNSWTAIGQLSKLQYLDLSNSNCDDKKLEALSTLEDLIELNLVSTRVTASGLSRLPSTGNLKRVILSPSSLGKSAIHQLVEQSRLHTIQVLTERENWAPILTTLASKDQGEPCGTQDEIQSINFLDYSLSDQDCKSLCSLDKLAKIELSALQNNPLELTALAQSPSLRTLTIKGSLASRENLDSWLEVISSFSKLTQLQIKTKGIPAVVIDELKQKLPDCTIKSE